jgi:tRNA-intron endonuclease
VGKKLIVFNHIHGSFLYGFGRFFGIPVGIYKPKRETFTRPLELSYFETFYLLRKSRIRVNESQNSKSYTPDEFLDFANENYPLFEEKYVIYEDLRNKGYIPRPGQKFGADFVIYEKGPGRDHSSFCIQVLSRAARISSIDVVRSARLASSVKKRFILANPVSKKYFSFKWYKP